MTDSLRGQLLVAAPSLRDPNFLRSVVLLVQHGEDGALGLIMNRPTDTLIGQVWEQVSETDCEAEGPLYLGGPIQGPLVAIHTQAEQADLEVLPGLFYSVQPSKLEYLVSQHEEQMRFITGYAGWGPGQLEFEMQEGAWIAGSVAAERIFSSDVQDWDKLLQELSTAQLFSIVKVKHIPPDPTWN